MPIARSPKWVSAARVPRLPLVTEGFRHRLRWPRLPRRASATLAAIALVLLTASPAAADHPPSVGHNMPATATELNPRPLNNSPMVVADPSEARFVALANRLDGPRFSCALQVSGDGGRGWVPADPVPKLPDGAERCYAPEVAFDGDGTLYYLFVGLRGLGNEPMGVFLTTSTDRARTFSPPRQVLGGGNYQVRMAIDPTVGPKGRIHLVWLRVSGPTPTGGLPLGPNPIVAAHSDNRGETFSIPVQVSDPARARVVAPALALGPDGAVHVAYYDLGNDVRDYQGLEGPTWEGTWSVLAATSTDRGRGFGPSVVVDDAVAPPGRVMLIYTMPPPSVAADGEGRLYAAWGDARLGDPDVFWARSTDGGRSWQRSRRLNDDREANGADQYLPRLGVSPDGRLDAIFYDRRNDPNNVFTHVYYAFSTDGGRNFAPNRKLTTAASNSSYGITYPIPSARGLIEYGSRLGLLSRSDSALVGWADIRNERSQDIFTATVSHRRHRTLTGWALAAGLLGAAVVAAVVLVARRRRAVAGRPVPASD